MVWTGQTFAVGQILTAAQMTNLQNDITAAFAKDTGAPVLANDYVTNAMIATNAVNADSITAGAVGTSEIATSGVAAAEIAAGAVGTSEIATNGVDTAELANNSVTADKIANGAVGTSEIATNGVAAAEITASAVGTSEIATSAVTASEIAANAVRMSEFYTTLGTYTTDSTFGLDDIIPGDGYFWIKNNTGGSTSDVLYEAYVNGSWTEIDAISVGTTGGAMYWLMSGTLRVRNSVSSTRSVSYQQFFG